MCVIWVCLTKKGHLDLIVRETQIVQQFVHHESIDCSVSLSFGNSWTRINQIRVVESLCRAQIRDFSFNPVCIGLLNYDTDIALSGRRHFRSFRAECTAWCGLPRGCSGDYRAGRGAGCGAGSR